MKETLEKPTQRLRVAVMGAGAVGGYLGGLLARAGHDVTLIARGEHLRAIQSTGLEIISQSNGSFTVQVKATDSPREVGPLDLVLYTVKTYDDESAIPIVRPLVGSGTTVLSLQNGVDSWQRLQASLPTDSVLPGAVYIEASVESPGVVKQQGKVYRLVFGEADGSITPRLQPIIEAFQDTGLPTEASTDIMKVLWSKWLFITTLAGVTAAARCSIADLLGIPVSRDLVITLLKEIEAVGKKRGIGLDTDIVNHTLQYMDNEARSLKASLQSDLEAGRQIELEALTGTVVRLGRESNVPTPANDVIYGLLKPYEEGS